MNFKHIPFKLSHTFRTYFFSSFIQFHIKILHVLQTTSFVIFFISQIVFIFDQNQCNFPSKLKKLSMYVYKVWANKSNEWINEWISSKIKTQTLLVRLSKFKSLYWKFLFVHGKNFNKIVFNGLQFYWGHLSWKRLRK